MFGDHLVEFQKVFGPCGGNCFRDDGDVLGGIGGLELEFRKGDAFGVVAVVVGASDVASICERVGYETGEDGRIGGVAGAVCGRGDEEVTSAQHIPGISLIAFLELEAAAGRKSEYWE